MDEDGRPGVGPAVRRSEAQDFLGAGAAGAGAGADEDSAGDGGAADVEGAGSGSSAIVGAGSTAFATDTLVFDDNGLPGMGVSGAVLTSVLTISGLVSFSTSFSTFTVRSSPLFPV